MADFVATVADYVRQFGQILHRGGGGKWRILSQIMPVQFSEFCVSAVADYGGL